MRSKRKGWVVMGWLGPGGTVPPTMPPPGQGLLKGQHWEGRTPAPSVAMLQAELKHGITASSHPRLWRAFYWRQWQQDQSRVLRLFPWSSQEFNRKEKKKKEPKL